MARVGAVIEQPVSINNKNDMLFGDIAYTTGGGTVQLSPDASAVCTPSAGLVHTGTCQAAKFEGNAGFLHMRLTVKQPNGNRITLTGPGGATMRVDNFTFGPGSGLTDQGQNGANHKFGISIWNWGSYTFYVGGTLHVAANQAPGVYNGTFDVQISYN
jgi:hypothetical protein